MRGRGQRRFIPKNPVSIHPYRETDFSLRGSLLIYSAPIPEDDECSIGKAFETLYWPSRTLLQEAVDFFKGVVVSYRLIAHMVEIRYDIHRENDVVGSPFLPMVGFFDSVYLNSCNFIIASVGLYLRNQSSWQIVRLKELQCQLGHYVPIRGSGFVETPPELAGRRGLISVRAVTNCFRYSLLCGIHGNDIVCAEQVKRMKKKNGSTKIRQGEMARSILENPLSYLDFLDKINLDFLGQDEGVALNEIWLVEQRHPTISVSVYGLVGKDIQILRATKEMRKNHVNM